jgi:hypothetical protein
VRYPVLIRAVALEVPNRLDTPAVQTLSFTKFVRGDYDEIAVLTLNNGWAFRKNGSAYASL